MTDGNGDDAEYQRKVDEAFAKRMKHLARKLNIVAVGTVSAGKSSVLNALLGCSPTQPKFEVKAKAGTTQHIRVEALNDCVQIVDSPGLDDIRAENSEVTRKFLERVDVGLFVMSGAADEAQRKNYEELRKTAKRTFVVLNQIDKYDDLDPSELEEVMDQWRSSLGIDLIFPTCAKGFNRAARVGSVPDLRGIPELRNAIYAFLETEGTAVLLDAIMDDKRAAVLKVIASACAAVTVEAFIPGSAVYITATQATAIATIYYLYTGRVMSKSQALGAIPAFAAQAVGTSLFLAAKSFLPPTGIVDAAAAVVALGVTLGMLLAVNTLFASGAELEDGAVLRAAFAQSRGRAAEALRGTSIADWKRETFWRDLLRRLMYA